MDFSLTEEQEMLRKIARDFLEKECPKTLVREMEEDEKGYSPELWAKMADLGWMGLIFPEKYGGMGLSILDLTILLEEMGRVLVPGPFLPTVILGGYPILIGGTEEQKQEYLPKIAKGEILLTMALTEPSFSYEPRDITVRATPERDNHVISGTKLFVPYAHIADWILCTARSKDGQRGEERISIFLVDGKGPRVDHTPLKTIDSDKQYEVNFKGVKVPKKYILGELHQGLEVVTKTLEQATVAQCALMLGGIQRALEMTVDYAKGRVQFGRPIGSFQAIHHKCADMLIYVDGARFLTYQAAWRLSEGLPCKGGISMAKVWTNEACAQIYSGAHQIHGGIGFIIDHDIGLYSRRAKAAEFAFGSADFHREIVAQQIGL